MEIIHQLTKEFMDTAGQTVREYPQVPTVEQMKFHISLEFEELFEKVQAMGIEGSFEAMVTLSIFKRANQQGNLADSILKEVEKDIKNNAFDGHLFDTDKVDIVEVFDAALDQRVVAGCTDLCFGFQHIIEEGDTEVHRSNMSKFDAGIDNARLTKDKYNSQKIVTRQEEVGNYTVTLRNEDNKVLKSHRYSPANLAPIIQAAIDGNDVKEYLPKEN